MNKIFLILTILVFAGLLSAQNSKTKPDSSAEREEIIYNIEREIPPGVVLDFLRKSDVAIKDGMKKGKNITFVKLSKFTSAAKIYLDYRWFVADTGLSKDWMKKVYDLLAYMNKIKRYMQTAEFNGRTKTQKYKKAAEYFNLAYKRFNELVTKPVRADSKLVQSVRAEKNEWQKTMRKKYNIKKQDSWSAVF